MEYRNWNFGKHHWKGNFLGRGRNGAMVATAWALILSLFHFITRYPKLRRMAIFNDIANSQLQSSSRSVDFYRRLFAHDMLGPAYTYGI